MELTDILAALRTRWWLLLVGLVLGGSAALAYTMLTTPMYTSTTQFFVTTTQSGSTSDRLQGSELSQQRAASYAELLKGTLLPTRVVEQLDLDISARTLSDRIEATALPETVLIDVSVQDPSPARAQQIAEALADEFIDRVDELESTDAGDGSIEVTVAEPADRPTGTTSPNRLLALAAGLAAGLALGGALALLYARLDTSLKDPDEAAVLSGVPTIGLIRRDDSIETTYANGQEGRSLVAEDFRRLRANLQYLRVDEPPAVIMVTSAMPSEGKTTTTLNLALALADAGRRVTIIDADLRRPKVAAYLDLVEGAGLTSVLTGTADIEDVTQRFGEQDLWVIASGPTPPNPGELLASAQMSTLIEKLRAQNDFVLVDAPPLLPVADSSGLSAHVDGVLLCVRYGVTRKHQVQQASTALDQVGASKLGLVLNMVPSRAKEMSGSYSYY